MIQKTNSVRQKRMSQANLLAGERNAGISTDPNDSALPADFDEEVEFPLDDDEKFEDEEDGGMVIDEADTLGDISTMQAMGFMVSPASGGTGRVKLTMSDAARESIRRSEGKVYRANKGRDRAERATQDQVLDPRTRMIILKFLNTGIITAINGCISTGKEANVYFCMTPTGPGALKVYKTSILVFKDRSKYLNGEFRFRHSKNSKNPRKMVAWWAEKEMRNLKRLNLANLPSPVRGFSGPCVLWLARPHMLSSCRPPHPASYLYIIYPRLHRFRCSTSATCCS